MSPIAKKQRLVSRKAKPVKFNIGGTHYEVSQSLLDRYPGSMLSKIASETWATVDDAGEATPIFVERNGTRFQYVLDYMRDCQVALPLSIPRSEFVLDMEYYGLDFQKESVTLSMDDYKEVYQYVRMHKTKMNAEREGIYNAYTQTVIKLFACEIAKAYFAKSAENQSYKDSYLKVSVTAPNVSSQFGKMSSEDTWQNTALS